MERAPPKEKTYASTLAGGIAGSAGGLLRLSIRPCVDVSLLILTLGGRGNILPGAIMFAVFGAMGQTAYNIMDTRNAGRPVEEASTQKTSWLNSKWSPVKVLSDAEYGEMLQEKLLKVNAEIALVDESLAALRKEQERKTDLHDDGSK